jgi:hypothetical protein
VYYVTNLNDAGEGSLRHGIETAQGPRTIVFSTSGTIRLRDRLIISKPFLTIAGQTAPGDGIAIADYDFNIRTRQIIVRHIRFRRGDKVQAPASMSSYGHLDAVDIQNSSDVIFDHVSASWGIDEVLSVVNSRTVTGNISNNITIQWSLITEALDNSYHPRGRHGYGSLVRGSFGSSYTFHHNLWAHHQSRMLRIGNYQHHTVDSIGVLADVRNNVIYNWGRVYAGYNFDTDSFDQASISRYNFINNYYQSGRDSRGLYIFYERAPMAQAYYSGNYMNGVLPKNPLDLVLLERNPAGYQQSVPFDVEPVETFTAPEAFERVLAKAGAWPRDAVDERVIQSVINKTGRIIDSQTQVGGWPALRATMAPVDSDGDGMPDWWETLHGLDPNNPDDRNHDRTGDGYTNLEEYLNWLADPGDYLPEHHPHNREMIYLPHIITLNYPTNYSNQVSSHPEFTWEEESYAAEYQFQLYLERWDLFLDTTVTENRLVLPFPLEPMQTYAWQVRGINEEGGPGPWSEQFLFWPKRPTYGEVPDEAHREVSLGQNFPNPFNPGTVISFTLPVEEEVSLMVYDLLGRRIAVLLDGKPLGPGNHIVEFNPGPGQSSGIYIYRLSIASGGEYSRPMTIMK